ncbi:hypothetical protein [uncultured Jatrophihabitans sp.]|uniref:hypothetical protein n=1 Tax=uncultured Jatrophihabitans sp. TaxID=1610747 RepID=UPI0035C97F38
MNTENSDHAGGPERTEAAALLAAVSRDDAASGAVRLHCLAALDVLDVPAPWKRHTIDNGDAQGCITRALHLLGALPLEQFGRPEVLTATRHARRALRELR